MPQASLTYARSFGPPEDWRGLRIFDEVTGCEIRSVVEVDTSAGWLIRHARNAMGVLYQNDAGEIATERLEGRFRIERPEPQ